MLFNFLQVIQFFIRENGPQLAADQDIIIIKAGSFDPKLLPRSRRTRKKKEKKKKK